MVVELKMQWTIRETSEELQSIDYLYYLRPIIDFPTSRNWLVFLQIDGTLFPYFQYYDRVRVALCIEEIW